jgi:sporulation protein YlmC with PRC-barrel domain
MRKIMVAASAFLFGLALIWGSASGFEDAAGPRFRDAPKMELEQTMEEFRDTNRIIGQTVRDPQGRAIGQVSEVMMNVETGQVQYVTVSAADPAVGRREILVPWDALQVDAARRSLVLDATPDQLRRAPSPDVVITPDAAQQIHEFYGVAPAWMDEAVPEMRTHQEPYPWELPSGEVQPRPEMGMQE